MENQTEKNIGEKVGDEEGEECWKARGRKKTSSLKFER